MPVKIHAYGGGLRECYENIQSVDAIEIRL